MAMNVYTVIRVDSLGSFRVRRDHRDVCQPEVGDIVFKHDEPKGRVVQVTQSGEDTFDVVIDRNSRILIANLLAIGVP